MSTSERLLFKYYQREGVEKHHFRTEIRHPFHKKRYATILALLKSLKNDGFLLDIGCAEGWLLYWSSPYVKLAVGIDVSIPKVRRGKKELRGRKMEYVVASFDALPFRVQAFDIIIWSEGPEHATRPEIVFKRLSELLKDGYIITSTMGINPPLFYKRIRQLMGVWKKEIEEWKKWGHVTIFTITDLRNLISKYFEIEKEIFLRPLLLLPFRKIESLIFDIIYKLTGRYLGSAWPGFGCFIVLAKKRM